MASLYVSSSSSSHFAGATEGVSFTGERKALFSFNRGSGGIIYSPSISMPTKPKPKPIPTKLKLKQQQVHHHLQ
jgi:hypothetical protein